MSKKEMINTVIILSLALIVALYFIIPLDKYNLYDYLKSKRLESYNQKHKEIFITCIYCNGTGEREEDVNKLMVEASITLFINKHLMVDKCKECAKLEKGDGYVYCKVVNDRYRTLLEEYIAAGRKIEMATCSECMGMGTFSSFDMTTQKYLTQEEYERKKRKLKINKELK
jgi:hypothetical protein